MARKFEADGSHPHSQVGLIFRGALGCLKLDVYVIDNLNNNLTKLRMNG